MMSPDEKIADDVLENGKECLVCYKAKDRANILDWAVGIYEPPREVSMLPPGIDFVAYLLCPSCLKKPGVTAEAEEKILTHAFMAEGRVH